MEPYAGVKKSYDRGLFLDSSKKLEELFLKVMEPRRRDLYFKRGTGSANAGACMLPRSDGLLACHHEAHVTMKRVEVLQYQKILVKSISTAYNQSVP